MLIEGKPECAELESLKEVMEVRRLLHELNNVLTGLMISSGLLKGATELDGKSERYLRDIERCSERAGGVVQEVRKHVHRLQEGLEAGFSDRTMVCDVRPSLGLGSGEH